MGLLYPHLLSKVFSGPALIDGGITVPRLFLFLNSLCGTGRPIYPTSVMAKSDYTCRLCKCVISQGFFQITQFKKYKCPNCGTICGKHVSYKLLRGNVCDKCGSRVISYAFVNNRWKQI